jgi:hypothetical protein
VKLEERLREIIRLQDGHVVLRADVQMLGSRAQVSRALTALIESGELVRIGAGIYAKTRQSSVTGALVPAGSLETLATEALERLGVKYGAGRAAADYNSGSTTQLPAQFAVNTGGRRILRKITVGGRTLAYENNYRRKT